MTTDKILIAEISGKRPGTKEQRPTEKMESIHPWVIVSNNSEGYVTDLPIINVPDDYREWYCNHIKNSDNAWYAPMNRSYAIKYARENGYRYLVQLDDNILRLEIANLKNENGVWKRYRSVYCSGKPGCMLDDFIHVLKTVLENTNACMAGCQLTGAAAPEWVFVRERYVYSIFMLDVARCPDVFQGDFEDDIEFRLKCKQMGTPVVQMPFLRYGKTGAERSKDLTGCREEYLKAGLKRGEHMSRLYGDLYSCKMSTKRATVMAKADSEAINFKHILKPFKVGVIVYNKGAIETAAKDILRKYAVEKPGKTIMKKKTVKLK